MGIIPDDYTQNDKKINIFEYYLDIQN